MNKNRKITKKFERRDSKSPEQWYRLFSQALQRARETQSPKLGLLERAITEKTIEKTLRKMSIVCPADIERELPPK